MTDETLQPEGFEETPIVDAGPGEGATDAENAESSTEAESEEVREKKKPWFTERIDELTANWRSTERQLESERAERQRLMDQLMQMQQTSSAPEQPQGEPQLDDFGSYEEYLSALTDYKAEQKIQAWQQQQEQQKTEAQKAEMAQAYAGRERQFAADHPDYLQVAHDPTLPVTDAMAEVIRQAENGPELLYQLGKQPSEAARIAAMPDYLAAMELGVFAAKLSAPQAKLNSAAPDPIPPLGGGDGGVVTDPAKAKSMDDYVKMRTQQRK